MRINHLIQYGLKMSKIIFHIKRIYCLIRYGKISSTTIDNINYTPCEIEYIETEFVNVTASGEPFIDNFTYELKDIELYICGKRVAS